MPFQDESNDLVKQFKALKFSQTELVVNLGVNVFPSGAPTAAPGDSCESSDVKINIAADRATTLQFQLCIISLLLASLRLLN